MKHIILLLFLFPVGLFAQDQADTTAVTYENRGGIFYTVTKTTYQSGRIVTEETPIGTDTASVVNAIIAPVFTAGTQLADQAAKVARIPRVRAQIAAANTALTALIGKDYFDLTNNLLAGEFLGANDGETGQQPESVECTMRVDGGAPITASIRRNAAGRLVYRQGTQNFTLDIISRNWIRIRRYDGSNTITPDAAIVDLFKEAPNRWISLDLKFILRL